MLVHALHLVVNMDVVETLVNGRMMIDPNVGDSYPTVKLVGLEKKGRRVLVLLLRLEGGRSSVRVVMHSNVVLVVNIDEVGMVNEKFLVHPNALVVYLTLVQILLENNSHGLGDVNVLRPNLDPVSRYKCL